MARPPLAALVLALAAPAFAGTARVELVPELGNVRGTPGVTDTVGTVSLQLTPVALTPSLAAAPALSPGSVFTPPAPVKTLTPVAPGSVAEFRPAALAPGVLKPALNAPAKGDEHPALIKTLSAPALELKNLGAGESSVSAEKDFNARAQLGEPVALAHGTLSAPSLDARPGGFGGSSFKPLKKGEARLPAVKTEEVPLDAAPTAQSLQALVADGSTRMLFLGADGKWAIRPRSSRSPYPTPEEVDETAGSTRRRFIASKSGLVEWDENGKGGAAAAIRSFLPLRLGWKLPFLAARVLDSAGVATRLTKWAKAESDGLSAGKPPVNQSVVALKVIPPLVAAEFPVVAAKLGRPVDEAYRKLVLSKTNGVPLFWHSPYTYKDHPDGVGIMDGHFRADFGIRLMVKPDWRKIPDLEANFRPLFAHEYVHWLQNEGFVSNKYGAEIAAVAVEVLRAIELVGMDGALAGRAATVHPGVMSSFEGGRQWARGGFTTDTTPYMKGSLAGAAYEAGVAAGRPEAAWEFLNLVIAGKGALEPAAAWAKVVGSK